MSEYANIIKAKYVPCVCVRFNMRDIWNPPIYRILSAYAFKYKANRIK